MQQKMILTCKVQFFLRTHLMGDFCVFWVYPWYRVKIIIKYGKTKETKSSSATAEPRSTCVSCRS